MGTTEWEGYHILDSVSASYGVVERARNAILRHYTRVRFETRPDAALERILRHYGFRQSHPVPKEGYRNELLDVISDARHTAPIFKTAELHSRVNSYTFVYVFKHRTRDSDYPSVRPRRVCCNVNKEELLMDRTRHAKYYFSNSLLKFV